MTLAVFNRAFEGILRRLGQDALLRGGPNPTRAVIEYGVQLLGDEDQVQDERTVAVLRKSDAARVGDTLSIGTLDAAGVFTATEHYRIDSPPQRDNGVSQSYVLLKINAP